MIVNHIPSLGQYCSSRLTLITTPRYTIQSYLTSDTGYSNFQYFLWNYYLRLIDDINWLYYTFSLASGSISIMASLQKCLYVYFMVLQTLALLAFLLGFFPVKTFPSRNASYSDLPTKINQTRLYPKDVYHRHVNKIVLMVIDGLRYDFVAGKDSEKNMPFVHRLIDKNNNCLLKARVATPTVTMPRIKALMTGSIPGFLDVILNFKTNEAVEDNILRQATKNGFFPIFYGDETWLNLFPHEFKRTETTESFFVNDFHEVDLNVTRNVEKELNSSDWDVMILHYLGLDHIGHVEGPQSMHIKSKLNEMDKIIAKLHKHLFKNVTHGNESVKNILVVTGDHGMRDSGGHGGGSLPEVLVPLLFFNHGCERDLRREEINQIDFTPLISVLLGLPIPAANLGKLDFRLIQNLDSLSKLYAMHYSTYSLKRIFESYFDFHSNPDFLISLQEAEQFFEICIKSGFTNSLENASLYRYFEIQKFMSGKMIAQNMNFDYYLIFMSIILLIQVWWMLFRGYQLVFNKHRILMSLLCFLVSIFINFVICLFSFGSSALCSNISHIPKLLVAVLSFNVFLMKPINRRVRVPSCDNLPMLFLLLLHLLSYASSSFIEEEHQFWYFFLSTVCIFKLISRPGYSCAIILIAHRFLQKLNQTGNKWAFVPDAGDWLNEEHNTNHMLFFYVAGQCALIYWCSEHLLGKHVRRWGRPIEKALFVSEIVIITLYRISIGNLKLPGISLPQTRGIIEVRLFWVFLIMQLLLYSGSLNFKSSKRKFMVNIIEYFLIIMLEIVALLHKPHNIVLIPGLLFFLEVITKSYPLNMYYLMALYQSLGMVFYFYQGNSNGFATIDVGAGFVGLEGFDIILSSFYVFVNTFSAIILSNILLLRIIFSSERKINLARRRRRDVLLCTDFIQAEFLDIHPSVPHSFYFLDGHAALRQNISYSEQTDTVEEEYYWFVAMVSCSYVIFYNILIYFHRHHLFVWTVFSPKLLYIGCHLLLLTIILVITILLELFHVIVSKYLEFK